MSAFVVHPEHINVLLWGALRASHGRVCWSYGNPTRMGELTDANATTIGDYPRVALGIAVMSIFVVTLNRTLWRPLYAYGERRMRMS